jgi:hypothetical protein
MMKTYELITRDPMCYQLKYYDNGTIEMIVMSDDIPVEVVYFNGSDAEKLALEWIESCGN